MYWPRCKRCQRWTEIVHSTHDKTFLFWLYDDEPFIDTWMVQAHDTIVRQCPQCGQRQVEQRTYDLRIQDDDAFCLN